MPYSPFWSPPAWAPCEVQPSGFHTQCPFLCTAPFSNQMVLPLMEVSSYRVHSGLFLDFAFTQVEFSFRRLRNTHANRFLTTPAYPLARHTWTTVELKPASDRFVQCHLKSWSLCHVPNSLWCYPIDLKTTSPGRLYYPHFPSKENEVHVRSSYPVHTVCSTQRPSRKKTNSYLLLDSSHALFRVCI